MNEIVEKLKSLEEPSREIDREIERIIAPANSFPTPRYTSSIDAALTLIPDDYVWDINHWGLVQLFSKDDPMRGILVSDKQRHPAISLCIAALRVRRHSDAAETKEPVPVD